MSEDKELEALKRAKLEKMMKRVIGRQLPKSPVKLTDLTIEEAVANNSLVVIDCWAPWCGPCKMFSPIFDKVAQEFSDHIFFGKLNTDKNPLVVNNFNIKSVPTILVFKHGKPVDHFTGLLSYEAFKRRITSHL